MADRWSLAKHIVTDETLSTSCRSSAPAKRLETARRMPPGGVPAAVIQLFLLCHALTWVIATPSYAFFEFEHRYLGNAAYRSAEREIRSRESASEQTRKFLADLEFVTTNILAFDKRPNSSRPPKPYTLQRRAEADLDLVPVRFGDISALAGDHAGDIATLERMILSFAGHPTERAGSESFMFLISPLARAGAAGEYSEGERISAIRDQWYRACRWYYQSFGHNAAMRSWNKLEDCFEEGGRGEELRDLRELIEHDSARFDNETDLRHYYYRGSAGYVRARQELSQFERLLYYTSSAAHNQAHFPQHSWATYLTEHRNALTLARYYARPKELSADDTALACPIIRGLTISKPRCALLKALLHEGMAQHYLHDSFASGHIGASPTRQDKQYLQLVHDTLNEFGLFVSIEELSKLLVQDEGVREYLRSTGWIAFGDGHLLIPEAALHRGLLVHLAKESLYEVFRAAADETLPPENAKLVCERWISVFPVPKDESYRALTQAKTVICRGDEAPEQKVRSVTADLVSTVGRLSPDPRVGGSPIEGWKFLLSGGAAFGNFDTLRTDLTISGRRSVAVKLAADIGYVRTTEPYFPNYWGAGASLVTDSRFSLYPLSVGYWLTPRDQELFVGYRLNVGLRMDESFTHANPSPTRQTSVELNMPLDVGVRIYKPFTLYLRVDYLNVTFKGAGGAGSHKGTTVDFLYLGRTGVLFGLMYDLSGP